MDRAVERFVSPLNIAYIEAGLGNADSPIEWLQRAVDLRDHSLPISIKRKQAIVSRIRAPEIVGRRRRSTQNFAGRTSHCLP